MSRVKDNNMITVKVRFFSNNINKEENEPSPKKVWSSGTINIEANSVHGIKSGVTIPFNSILEISAKIEKLLINSGIKMYLSKRMQKYIKSAKLTPKNMEAFKKRKAKKLMSVE